MICIRVSHVRLSICHRGMKRRAELELDERNKSDQAVPHHLLVDGRWTPLPVVSIDVSRSYGLADFGPFLDAPLGDGVSSALMSHDFSFILVRTAHAVFVFKGHYTTVSRVLRETWGNTYSGIAVPMMLRTQCPSIMPVPFHELPLQFPSKLIFFDDYAMIRTSMRRSPGSCWQQWGRPGDLKTEITLRSDYNREEHEEYQLVCTRKYLILSAVFGDHSLPGELLALVFGGRLAFVWLHDYLEIEKEIEDCSARDPVTGHIDLMKLPY